MAAAYSLMLAAPVIDACTTLTERCELLNVNVADRGGLTDDDGIVRIVFEHALENSAERRRAAINDGPLFQAVRWVLLDFLKTPEGQAAADELCGLDAIFGDLVYNKTAFHRICKGGSTTRSD